MGQGTRMLHIMNVYHETTHWKNLSERQWVRHETKTPFRVIVSFFSNGKHWSKQQLLRLFAFDIFISELNSFAAKECVIVFQKQPCFNFIIGNDEIAEIYKYFQFQIFRCLTFKTVEIKISSRMWKQLLQILIYKLLIDGSNALNIPKWDESS